MELEPTLAEQKQGAETAESSHLHSQINWRRERGYFVLF